MRTFLALAFFGLAGSGCGPAKLDVNRTLTLEPDGENIKAVIMPPQSKAQKLTVTIDSPIEVDVFVVDAKKANPEDLAPFGKLSPDKQRESSLGSKTQVKKDTLTVDIPANTSYSVIATNAKKKTDVKLGITNQK